MFTDYEGTKMMEILDGFARRIEDLTDERASVLDAWNDRDREWLVGRGYLPKRTEDSNENG